MLQDIVTIEQLSSFFNKLSEDFMYLLFISGKGFYVFKSNYYIIAEIDKIEKTTKLDMEDKCHVIEGFR